MSKKISLGTLRNVLNEIEKDMIEDITWNAKFKEFEKAHNSINTLEILHKVWKNSYLKAR